MHPILPFCIIIDLTLPLWGSLTWPLAILQSNVVELPLLLSLTTWDREAVVQSPDSSMSCAKSNTGLGKLIFWLLRVDRALVIESFAISWSSKAIGEVSMGEFWALGCFIFQHSSIYAFSFWLSDVIYLNQHPRTFSPVIIHGCPWIVGVWFLAGTKMDGQNSYFFASSLNDSHDSYCSWWGSCCCGVWPSILSLISAVRSRQLLMLSKLTLLNINCM